MPDEPNKDGQQPEQTPAPTPEQIDERNRKIAKTGLSRLGYVIAEATPPPSTKPEPEKKPEETGGDKPADGVATADVATKPNDEEKVAEQPKEEPTKEEPPKRRVKKVDPATTPKPATLDDIKAVIEGVVSSQSRHTQQAQPAAEPEKPKEPEMLPQDREELELARFAEQAEPEKYRGMSQRWIEFVAKRDAFAAAKIKQDGEFDPNGEDFKQFVEQNRPSYQRGDRRKLEVAKIEDGAVKRAHAEFEKEKVKLRREIAKITTVPQIQQTTTKVIENILGDDDPSIKEFKEDPKKFIQEVPLEAQIIDGTLREVSSLTTEYLKIAKGIEDASADNPMHVVLDRFIAAQGEALERRPESERIRDGKVLISRERYFKLAEGRDPSIGRFATFTDDDIVVMIEEGGRQKIRKQLDPLRKTYERKRPAAATAATQKVEEKPKPAAAKEPEKPTGAAASPAAVSSRTGAAPAKGGPASKSQGHMRALGYG